MILPIMIILNNMIKVGITGQQGFIGSHLFNTLGLFPERFERVYFEDSYYSNDDKLSEFVAGCDTIVHHAALNRHPDPDVIYQTNVDLVKRLLTVCDHSKVKPHIIFSSSTQEQQNNSYGLSKKEGRKLFERWAAERGANFTGFVIPNVFGPFCKPYYNSVVATFCHQLTHKETPQIITDSEVNLIYIGTLIQKIIGEIESKYNVDSSAKTFESIQVSPDKKIKVSDLLEKLLQFRDNYLCSGCIPGLSDSFNLVLFNTFISYIDHQDFYPFQLTANTDNRGTFVEIAKLSSGGQVSFSVTHPGITRGNHFHTRKAERFAVIRGKARIELRKIGSNQKLEFILDGEKPSFVDMPVWYTHNITNIGDDELFTIFWINEIFDKSDPDTYFELV